MADLHSVLLGQGGCTSHRPSSQPSGERDSETQPGGQAAAGQRSDVSPSCPQLHASTEHCMAMLEPEVTLAVNETRQRWGTRY